MIEQNEQNWRSLTDGQFLRARSHIEIRIVCEFSSYYFIRSVYASPTSHIILSQASVLNQQIQICSAFYSWFRRRELMELHRYIIYEVADTE